MTEASKKPKKNSKYVQCWNCDGYIGRKLLVREDINNTCPLCEATEVLDDGMGTTT